MTTMLTRARFLRWLLPVLVLAGVSGATAQSKTETAIFAAGCFWCVEEAFEKVPGVIAAVSGYAGGTLKNPTYEQVTTGRTGHYEAVKITYDPGKVSYRQLVDWFWRNVDPHDADGQFCDKGPHYRGAIFYQGEAQKKVADESKTALAGQLKRPIVTDILAAGPFYDAEDYHQDYYKKNANRYQFYKHGCRRVQRLEQVWGKPTPPPNT
jgi:peptide-methionine (S)-S-oxide reductase